MNLRTDPHESYNPNFYEDDWQAYQRDPKTIEVANRVRSIIDSGLVACINHSLLCDINFDLRARVDYPAPILQESYYPHWAALAIAMLTHACFESFEEEKVTRFYKSKSTNPLMYPPNLEWYYDSLGKEHYRFKKEIRMKELAESEF